MPPRWAQHITTAMPLLDRGAGQVTLFTVCWAMMFLLTKDLPVGSAGGTRPPTSFKIAANCGGYTLQPVPGQKTWTSISP
jgi:hypothetical protein